VSDEVASLTRKLIVLPRRVTQHEQETDPNCYEEHNCEGKRRHARASLPSLLVNSCTTRCETVTFLARHAGALAPLRGSEAITPSDGVVAECPSTMANSMTPATTGRMIQARASIGPSCPRRVCVKRQPAGCDFARTAECTGHRSMSMTTLTSSSWRCSAEGQSLRGTRRVISRCNQSASARESVLTAAR
jgi:hypothetical protein